MPRFTPAVASLSLVLVLLASACEPPRWIPPEHPGEAGRCSRQRSCSGVNYECLRAAHSDTLACAIDRARQLGAARGPRAGFDALALSVLGQNGHCNVDPHVQQASFAELMRFYPAVRREIDAAARAGLV